MHPISKASSLLSTRHPRLQIKPTTTSWDPVSLKRSFAPLACPGWLSGRFGHEAQMWPWCSQQSSVASKNQFVTAISLLLTFSVHGSVSIMMLNMMDGNPLSQRNRSSICVQNWCAGCTDVPIQINFHYGELVSADSVTWSMVLLFSFRIGPEDCNTELFSFRYFPCWLAKANLSLQCSS